jgi:NAD(P)-dependent dehydrogenase (short-subunit alcohol dehydrogenase family)
MVKCCLTKEGSYQKGYLATDTAAAANAESILRYFIHTSLTRQIIHKKTHCHFEPICNYFVSTQLQETHCSMPESTPKNIIITGGARGLGRVLARYLAVRGHRLFLLDIDEEELKYCATVHIPKFLAQSSGVTNGELSNGELKNGTHGKEIHFKKVNLRDHVAVREAVKEAAEIFGGRIDVLINNAGIARAQWSGERSMDDESVYEEWIAYMETNLTAPFLVSQACIPFMKNNDKEIKDGEFSIRPEAQASAAGKSEKEILASIGSSSPCIIHISSFRALQSAPNCEGYASSKAGMLGLTHSMSVSGARWGIRCNAILPGFVYVLHECKKGDEEGHVWCQQPEAIGEARHRTHPAGRIGMGDDVSKTVEWLMDADFVTGQEIIVDGGCNKIKYAHA